jgi:hypothetical protein
MRAWAAKASAAAFLDKPFAGKELLLVAEEAVCR